jgi:small-conductance mechanosensitive channel
LRPAVGQVATHEEEAGMIWDPMTAVAARLAAKFHQAAVDPSTYQQLALAAAIVVLAYLAAGWLLRLFPILGGAPTAAVAHPVPRRIGSFRWLVGPLVAIVLLRIAVDAGRPLFGSPWLLQSVLAAGVLAVFYRLIRTLVRRQPLANSLVWSGAVLLGLHFAGLLGELVAILESIALSAGTINISLYDLIRVVLFGSLLFWLGRLSNSTGQDIIRRQHHLDLRTREVAAKLLQITVSAAVFLLLLQVMGITLTTLAVFGGAVGVGLGFGLQAIASNFISGIIILLDRSVAVDDYIQLEDGRTGVVRELNMRSTTLETFDGKDVMVPNEKFIVETFTNWTHKNKKQRYRVDFSVAYHSDIRRLVPVIKAAVATHPQVIHGDGIPLEEQPDCEIDSFGDSGINMFVEFWMEGIDDGRNRVGGDLMLLILETLREHGFEIPFPQREVRVLGPQAGLRPSGSP